MSQVMKVFMLLRDNPGLSNAELAEATGYSDPQVRKYRWLLKKRGYIAPAPDGKGVLLLRDYTDPDAAEDISFKQEVYTEMVLTYLEDFRAQPSFKDRVTVGREIRLLLEAM